MGNSDIQDLKDQNANNYLYDKLGRMTANLAEDIQYIYNTQGLVTEIRKRSNNNLIIAMAYNERGQRIQKNSYNTTNGSLLSTDYYVLDIAGNTVGIYNKPATQTIVLKENVIFGLSRIGVYKRQTSLASYEITDHLGNVRAVIQENPNPFSILSSYADYYAFGEQLPSRNTSSDYRYAFQGQELDKETGMEAFQLRLWDGRIGRWLSPDPYGEFDSPYLGMGNNPVNLIDPTGGSTDDPPTKGIPHWNDNTGDYYWNSITNTYDHYAPQVNSLSSFDAANALMSTSFTISSLAVPLDKYMEAFKQNKFIFNFNGNDKLWSTNFNGGTRANISNSLINNAKIETKVLGNIGNGLKYGGAALSFLSFASAETQYRLGYINDNQILKSRLDNSFGVLFPVASLGFIPGNYLGEKYQPQIVNQMTNPHAFTHKAIVKFLNLFGLPASQEQHQKGF